MFVGVVVEVVVEVGAGLHGVEDVLLGAVGADVLVDVEGGGVHGAEGGEGIER